MNPSDPAETLSVFSKDHTSAIVSSIRLAILDRHCLVVWVNEKFCSLTQYTKDDVIGRPLCDLNLVCLAPEDFNSIHEEISGGKTWSGEIKGLTKEGLQIWVSVTILPISNSENCIESYLLFIEDITDTKQAFENLKKHEARYRAVVDNRSDIMSLCRVDGTRTFVNKEFCDFMGKSSEEIVGTNFLDSPLKGLPYQMYQDVFNLTLDNPEISGVFELENAKREKVWMSISFRGIFDAEGRLYEILTIGRDVTELKTGEINKGKYIDELERIAFMTSHKVRAPISELLGFLELLRIHAIHTNEWGNVLGNFKASVEKLDSYTRELGAFIYQSRSSKINS